MSEILDLDQQVQLQDGILAASREMGYVKEVSGTEQVDRIGIIQTLVVPISKAIARSTAEVATNALTKPTVVSHAYPEIPLKDTPDYVAGTDLDRLVWTAINRMVWGLVDTNYSSRMQKAMGQTGFWMCKVKISATPGSLEIPAVYVTDEIELLKRDFSGPLKDGIRIASLKMANNIAAVIGRQQQHKKALTKEVDAGMKAAATLAASALALGTGENAEV